MQKSITVCDRCAAEEHRPINDGKVIERKNTVQGEVLERFDLCPLCDVDFSAFIKHAPNPDRPSYEAMAQMSDAWLALWRLIPVEAKESRLWKTDKKKAIDLAVDYFRELQEDHKTRARAQSTLHEALLTAHNPETCPQVECPICGALACPYSCDEHEWKDGCPCCYGTPVDPIWRPSDANCTICTPQTKGTVDEFTIGDITHYKCRACGVNWRRTL